MFRIRTRMTNFLLAALDAVILSAAFLAVRMWCAREYSPLALWVGLGMLFPFCLMTLSFFGLYNSRRTGSCFSDRVIIVKSWILVSALLTILNLVLRESSLHPISLIPFVTFALLTLAIFRSTLRLILRRLRERGINTKKLILVGLSPFVDQILNSISTHLFYGYQVIGVFGPSSTDETTYPRKGEMDDLMESLERDCPDEVIIALPLECSFKLVDLIRACELQGVQAKVMECLAPALGARGPIDDMGGIKLVSVHSYPTERLGYFVFKRLFDLLASFSLFVLLTPLMLVIALAISCSSQGPILFRQQRVGLKGKRFWMVKFRTMTHVEDKVSDTEWMPQDTDRFTPLGRFLRRTNLDELPQLWNVFMGQMSLVGPRPERPFYTEMFRKEVPHYMQRHYIQCGMTGWAQINGWRGNTSIQRRVEHDLYYLKNWGLWFDVKILVFTLFRGLYQRRAYW